MKVTVIGQGYVGLNLAIGAARAGFNVTGLDIDKNLVLDLLEGKTVIPGITQRTIKKLIKNGKYTPSFSTEAMKDSDIVVIAVPTPLTQDRKPDLFFLETAAKQIAVNLSNRALIINESTSYPGTLRNFIKPIIESISDIEFDYASAPERIDPGNDKWNLDNTPRVIGGLTESALDKAAKFYKTFCSQVFLARTPEIAEASKLFENTFRQVNIALANEFSKISNSLGFSTHEAIRAAATKPFGFMEFYPSIGVGGHCIPIDPTYLSFTANRLGIPTEIIELSNKTNLLMPNYVVDKLRDYLESPLNGKRIQIAGIAYKVGVSDLRESPALILIKELRNAGATVSWHDPLVNRYKDEVSEPLDKSIDLGLIVTPHVEIDFKIWRNSETRVLDLSANSKDYGWPKFL